MCEVCRSRTLPLAEDSIVTRSTILGCQVRHGQWGWAIVLCPYHLRSDQDLILASTDAFTNARTTHHAHTRTRTRHVSAAFKRRQLHTEAMCQPLGHTTSSLAYSRARRDKHVYHNLCHSSCVYLTTDPADSRWANAHHGTLLGQPRKNNTSAEPPSYTTSTHPALASPTRVCRLCELHDSPGRPKE